MADRLFVFIDESGDCGDNDGTGDNTIYYAEVALQVAESGIPAIRNHMAYWRYTKGIYGELSTLPQSKDFEALVLRLRRYLPAMGLYSACLR